MKNTILVGMILLALGVVITTGFSRQPTKLKQSVNGRLNVKDLPDDGLNIIPPLNPAYSELISNLLKGKPNPIIESLAPPSSRIQQTKSKSMSNNTALGWIF